MKKKTAPSSKRADIGGQAVMEGVMMKSPNAIAIAVRRPDGTIVVKRNDYTSPAAKRPWMGWFFLRGIMNMGTMFSMGMSTLQQSTEMLGIMDEEPTKFELWLSKKLGKGIDKIVMFVAIVLAIALSIGLFMMLPEFFGRQLKGLWPAPEMSWLVNLFTGLIRLLILVAYILFCARVPDVRRTFQYHGAEHKTVYCNENDLPLTPENAQSFSSLHPRCGTSFLVIVFALSIIIFTAFGYQGSNYFLRLGSRLLLLPVGAGLSYEVLKGLAHSNTPLTRALRWPGMQLQRLTTKPPTDEMVEVAIAAMNVALHGMPKPQEGVEKLEDGCLALSDYRFSDPSYIPDPKEAKEESREEILEEAFEKAAEEVGLESDMESISDASSPLE